eukprot:TRINITY_DN1978_c0_g1_i2.p1 TRINITY_DN1978_c0_g1~~TRINITY_DN1978_c0_g1_i2.p1  ORF type:complete len:326 (+),score=78.24 TRINITY_DN1978_c0_g1_i2:931-1908(+)
MKTLAVDKLPGVGPAMKERLQALGVTSMEHLQARSKDSLQQEFGQKKGEMLFNSTRGLDSQPLRLVQPRKSVGTQISWGVRYETDEQMKAFLSDMAAEVSKRMQAANVKGENISLRIKRHASGNVESEKMLNPGQVEIMSKSRKIAWPTDCPEALSREVVELYQSMHIPSREVRGAGIAVDHLVDNATQNSKGVTLTDMWAKKQSPQQKPQQSQAPQSSPLQQSPLPPALRPSPAQQSPVQSLPLQQSPLPQAPPPQLPVPQQEPLAKQTKQAAHKTATRAKGTSKKGSHKKAAGSKKRKSTSPEPAQKKQRQLTMDSFAMTKKS